MESCSFKVISRPPLLIVSHRQHSPPSSFCAQSPLGPILVRSAFSPFSLFYATNPLGIDALATKKRRRTHHRVTSTPSLMPHTCERHQSTYTVAGCVKNRNGDLEGRPRGPCLKGRMVLEFYPTASPQLNRKLERTLSNRKKNVPFLSIRLLFFFLLLVITCQLTLLHTQNNTHPSCRLPDPLIPRALSSS